MPFEDATKRYCCFERFGDSSQSNNLIQQGSRKFVVHRNMT